MDDLINKLLEKNPKKRISWEEYFNHPFLFTKIENGNELVPHRAELENIQSQKITLLIPPTSGPNHPATVFFINNPNINHNSSQFNYKTKNITITQKKYMVLYKGYKDEPLCLTDPLKYNGIIKTIIFDNSNLIWKLMKEEQMFSFLKTLNKYQKYNHFPMTWQLVKKDNLYNNYFCMKTKFPNDYNYMPETYILPKDLLIIKEKLKDLDLNDKTNLWLIKPIASSRGKGIKLLTNINDVPQKSIVTHYIYDPHLINAKKYDIRLYLLITGYCPLKIYLFKNGMARFSPEEYDLAPEKMSNLNIHLTDHPNNKISSNNEENTSEQDNENKWPLKSLKNYFSQNNLNFNEIWEKIKDIMIKTIISVTDLAIPLLKSFNLSSVNLFELYGIDILLDSNFNPWLLEVNLNPSLDCSTQIDLKLKSKLFTDIFNIIGIVPFSHDGKFELIDKPNIYKDSVEEGVIESLCEFERPTGEFERIFPLKNNIEYYRKFISKPEQENLTLWETILNSK